MSGDLAHKKIFPALYSMVKKGELDIPVIGVASSKWTVDDLAHPRATTASPSTAAAIDDEAAFEKLTGLLRYVDGDYNDAVDVHRAEAGARRTRSARSHYLAIPPSMFETVVQGLGASGCAENAARDRREAVRPRPRSRPRS